MGSFCNRLQKELGLRIMPALPVIGGLKGSKLGEIEVMTLRFTAGAASCVCAVSVDGAQSQGQLAAHLVTLNNMSEGPAAFASRLQSTEPTGAF